MKVDLLIDNCGQLVTLSGPAGASGARRGAAMRDLGLIENGTVAVAAGRILETGPSRDLSARYQARTRIDAGGRAVAPGFVDPHTHLPWAGDRAAEFEMRTRRCARNGKNCAWAFRQAGRSSAMSFARRAPSTWNNPGGY